MCARWCHASFCNFSCDFTIILDSVVFPPFVFCILFFLLHLINGKQTYSVYCCFHFFPAIHFFLSYWKTRDSYLIISLVRFNNCTFLLLNANIQPLLLVDDIHVFLSQLICYSEVCSGRVNTNLELGDSQHESVISYEILVAIYCC